MLDRRLKGPRRTAPLWDKAGAHCRVSHLRAARGSFCKRRRVSKEKPRPLGGSGAVLQAVPRFQREVSPPRPDARAVLQVMSRFQREVSPPGRVWGFVLQAKLSSQRETDTLQVL